MDDITFEDRAQAGHVLGGFLRSKNYENSIVFGVPRGGVVVAAEVAKQLEAPLDAVIVRKLGVPGNPELGFGAIAPDNVAVLDHEMVERIGITPEEIEEVQRNELAELDRRLEVYRGTKEPPEVKGRTAIIVDDGAATGGTMRAAAAYINKLKPEKLVIAVPVCAPDITADLEKSADEVMCILVPEFFGAVGQFYLRFPQTTDEEVTDLLR